MKCPSNIGHTNLQINIYMDKGGVISGKIPVYLEHRILHHVQNTPCVPKTDNNYNEK